MGLFDRITTRIKDRTRRQLCNDLLAMGLNVHIAELGQPEQRISGGLMGTSLGLIDVEESPIRWINVLEHPASRYAATTYTNVYIVPDNRVRSGGYLELRSARKRSASVYGRVIDVSWTANFVGTRVVTTPEEEWDADMEEKFLEEINNDPALKESMIRLNEDIMVRSVPNFWCWAILAGSYHESGTGHESRSLAPSREQWECYELIARHLLESSTIEKDSKEIKPQRSKDTTPQEEEKPSEAEPS